jgi:hypothetical protein
VLTVALEFMPEEVEAMMERARRRATGGARVS